MSLGSYQVESNRFDAIIVTEKNKNKFIANCALT